MPPAPTRAGFRAAGAHMGSPPSTPHTRLGKSATTSTSSGPLKKPRRRYFDASWKCKDCNRNSTPVRRHGPEGPRTLCNACGLRRSKQRRLAAAAASNNGAQSSAVAEGGTPTLSESDVNARSQDVTPIPLPTLAPAPPLSGEPMVAPVLPNAGNVSVSKGNSSAIMKSESTRKPTVQQLGSKAVISKSPVKSASGTSKGSPSKSKRKNVKGSKGGSRASDSMSPGTSPRVLVTPQKPVTTRVGSSFVSSRPAAPSPPPLDIAPALSDLSGLLFPEESQMPATPVTPARRQPPIATWTRGHSSNMDSEGMFVRPSAEQLIADTLDDILEGLPSTPEVCSGYQANFSPLSSPDSTRGPVSAPYHTAPQQLFNISEAPAPQVQTPVQETVPVQCDVGQLSKKQPCHYDYCHDEERPQYPEQINCQDFHEYPNLKAPAAHAVPPFSQTMSNERCCGPLQLDVNASVQQHHAELASLLQKSVTRPCDVQTRAPLDVCVSNVSQYAFEESMPSVPLAQIEFSDASTGNLLSSIGSSNESFPNAF